MTQQTDLDILLQVFRKGDFLIMDTETLGKELNSRICQIAIIDDKGQTLLDTLVNPGQPISNSFIHGITDEMVKDAPPMRDILIEIFNQLHQRTVIIYNEGYDVPILTNEFKREKMVFPTINTCCAMRGYAEFVGDWSDYWGNYSYQKLTSAAKRVRYTLPDGIKEHSALGDCLMTLAVCQFLAGKVKSNG